MPNADTSGMMVGRLGSVIGPGVVPGHLVST